MPNEQVVDVVKLGWLPGSAFAANNRRLLYAALGKPLTGPNGATSTARLIQLPATWPDRYFVDRPLRLPAGCQVQGPGAAWGGLGTIYGAWAVMLGLPVNPLNSQGQAVPFSPDHYADLSGVTDGSVGKRYGWRSKGDSFLAFPGSFVARPLGDHLTIQAAFDNHADPFTDCILFGLSSGGGPSPWQVRLGFGQLWFGFRTSDGVLRSCYVPGVAWPGTTRFAFDLDLAAGKLLAVVNGKQVAVPGTYLGADFPKGKLKFAANASAELTVGIDSLGAQPDTILDFTLLGLHLTAGGVYKDQGDGKPAVRLDGKPIQDARLYDESDGWWYLRGEEGPLEDLTSTGLIPTRPDNDYGIVLTPAHAAVSGTSHDAALRELTVAGGVLLGPLYDAEIDHCTINGSVDGIASLFPTATFPTLITRSKVSGQRYPISLWGQAMVTLRDIHVLSAGRACILLRECGQIKIADVFMTGFGPVEYAIEINGTGDASWTTVENVGGDFEGLPYPSGAMLCVTAGSGQTGTKLRARSISCGSLPEAVPIMVLRSREGVTGAVAPAKADIADCGTSFGLPVIARVESKQWWGKVQMGGGWPDGAVVTGPGAGQFHVERPGTPELWQPVPQGE